jgi:hypothetical protein
MQCIVSVGGAIAPELLYSAEEITLLNSKEPNSKRWLKPAVDKCLKVIPDSAETHCAILATVVKVKVK